MQVADRRMMASVGSMIFGSSRCGRLAQSEQDPVAICWGGIAGVQWVTWNMCRRSLSRLSHNPNLGEPHEWNSSTRAERWRRSAGRHR
jgi:hypothetical protein